MAYTDIDNPTDFFRIKLYNGKLESRLVKYEIYSGSKKRHKKNLKFN